MRSGAAQAESGPDVSSASTPPGSLGGTDLRATSPDSRHTALGLFAAAVAFLLPLAFSPALDASVWGAKAAVGLVIAGVGVPMLLRERTRAGWAAVSFLAIAFISTLLSDSPGMSFGGLWNWGTGLALTAAAVGAWSLGRRLSGADRRLLELGLVASVTLVACVAIVQSRIDLSAFGVIPAFGRPTAFQGNPVYLGGIVLIGIAIASWRAARGSPWWLAILFTCSVAGSVGLGRVTLAVALAVALLQLRANRLKGFAVVAVVVLAWGTGAVLGATSSVAGSVGDRIDGPTAEVTVESYTVRQGLGPRLATWFSARHAVAEHPVIGAGPGRFWAATVGHRPLSVTRFSPNTYYADPHNFLVEYAVTTGILGVGLLAVWLGLAARRASGPLGLAALALGLVHLIQPQNAAVTPLAMLCLGAAGPVAIIPPAVAVRASRALTVVTTSAAASLAVIFLVGQFSLRQAYLDFDVAHADRAYRFLPFWPDVAERRATVAAGDLAFGATPNWEEARRYYREATRRDPADPRTWLNLGDFEQARRNPGAAETAYETALTVEPNSLRAFSGLWAIAHLRGDEEMRAHWRERVEMITGRR